MSWAHWGSLVGIRQPSRESRQHSHILWTKPKHPVSTFGGMAGTGFENICDDSVARQTSARWSNPPPTLSWLDRVVFVLSSFVLGVSATAITLHGLAISGLVFSSSALVLVWGRHGAEFLRIADFPTLTLAWGLLWLPLSLVPLGFLAPLVWLVAASMSTLAALAVYVGLFYRPRQGLGAMIIVIGLIATWWMGTQSRLDLRSLQVRIAQLDPELDEPYQEADGVSGWIWLGGIPDGGMGPAHDPTHRLGENEFTAETWWKITGDYGRCQHLYDDWFWCG